MAEPRRVSKRVKIFCYVGINFGSIVLFGFVFLEQPSAIRLSLLFLAPMFWNLLLWLMFRMKDREVEAYRAKNASTARQASR